MLEGFKEKLKANIAKEQVVTGVYFKGKENLISETDRMVTLPNVKISEKTNGFLTACDLQMN